MRIHLKQTYILFTLVICLILLGVLFLTTPTASAATCSPTQAFIMTVDTTKTGQTTNTQFRIPVTGTGPNYRVDINGDSD